MSVHTDSGIMSPMADRDREIAAAFDGQAEQFERGPLQTDAARLARLVGFAELPAGALVLAAGCGPGLVSEALAAVGHRVVGFDLSAEMIRRARVRCARFGDRVRFEQRSVFDLDATVPFDAALSRLVVHHVSDPLAFVLRQVALVRPGGTVLVCDHTTDPDPARAAWHQDVERARDRTHARSLTSGQLVDLLVAAGLHAVRFEEESYWLDFDEWFDRGTPDTAKDVVRARILSGSARGFRPEPASDGTIRIEGSLALVAGRRLTSSGRAPR